MEGGDYKGLGIVFPEASVMGLPAVAGRCGGAVEAVENGSTGLVVYPSSDEERQEALHRLMKSSRSRSKLGRNARNRVLEKFSWGRAVRRPFGPPRVLEQAA